MIVISFLAAAVLSSSVCYRAVFAEEECISEFHNLGTEHYNLEVASLGVLQDRSIGAQTPQEQRLTSLLKLLFPDKGIPCYNCDSTLDPNCADPWNFTEYYDIGIPIQKCVG